MMTLLFISLVAFLWIIVGFISVAIMNAAHGIEPLTPASWAFCVLVWPFTLFITVMIWLDR